jgi:hypothetical protein
LSSDVDNSFLSEEILAARRSVQVRGGVDLGVVTGMSGYAEMFETMDGTAIPCGYFITLNGRKVRKATSTDRYILGVTSAAPAVLGNGSDVRWKNKYLTDEWGHIQYHEIIVPAVVDEEGKVLIPEHKEKQARINPDWDKNKPYLPRILRPEWVAVSLIGQVLVRDNGTCKVNGYCIPNDDGIAISASRGYRVMERRTPNQILMLLRSNSVSVK